jgi:hypothetical protein
MKLEFWLELPNSLLDLCENEISTDESSFALMLENSRKVNNLIT